MPTTPPAFLIDDDTLATAEAGTTMQLAGPEGRHAAKVARIGVGERLLLTDHAGRQAPATVTAARKEALDLVLEEAPSAPVERTPRLVLVQALATGGRDEQAVESATELGVDEVIPWIAQRSVSVWRGPKLEKGREKWESMVRAAVKQCRRRGVPQVAAAVDSRALTALIQERCEQGALALVLHEQESSALMALREEIAASTAPQILVLVGPEGGISQEELQALRGAGARSVLLGPEVLRSSTAGPAALAVLSSLLGRWS